MTAELLQTQVMRWSCYDYGNSEKQTCQIYPYPKKNNLLTYRSYRYLLIFENFWIRTVPNKNGVGCLCFRAALVLHLCVLGWPIALSGWKGALCCCCTPRHLPGHVSVGGEWEATFTRTWVPLSARKPQPAGWPRLVCCAGWLHQPGYLV